MLIVVSLYQTQSVSNEKLYLLRQLKLFESQLSEWEILLNQKEINSISISSVNSMSLHKYCDKLCNTCIFKLKEQWIKMI